MTNPDLTKTMVAEQTREMDLLRFATARVTERGATRGDDKFSEAAMEDRKKEGYF